jgi:hypothetical protein
LQERYGSDPRITLHYGAIAARAGEYTLYRCREDLAPCGDVAFLSGLASFERARLLESLRRHARLLGPDLAQGHPVLAIDGDNNPNLGLALGIPPEVVDEIPTLPRDLLKDVEDEQGNKSQVLTLTLEEIALQYGTSAPDNVRLLAMNRIDHAAKG